MCQINTDDTDPNINLDNDLDFELAEPEEKIDQLWFDIGGEG